MWSENFNLIFHSTDLVIFLRYYLLPSQLLSYYILKIILNLLNINISCMGVYLIDRVTYLFLLNIK